MILTSQKRAVGLRFRSSFTNAWQLEEVIVIEERAYATKHNLQQWYSSKYKSSSTENLRTVPCEKKQKHDEQKTKYSVILSDKSEKIYLANNLTMGV